MAHILVVDDEAGMREFLTLLLEKEGHRVTCAKDGLEALHFLKEGPVDLVISDLKMPKLDGVGLLSGLREIDPSLPLIVVTAYASVESAIQAMKLGAYDYIIKPFKVEELRLIVQKAMEVEALRRENLYLKQELRERRFPGLTGSGLKMQALFDLIERVAPISTTVLITGESGTGKELVARAIHAASPRSEKPFLAINCGAIPEQLLESELFGHVKGAFTGAIAHKTGLFEVADGGTIFLDEIVEMSPALQVKLLRVLQERTFRRVGGTEDIKVDVRLIAATNKDPKEAIARGTFREDLYWRLNVIPVHLPPLKERKEDIPLLAKEFLGRFAKEQRREEFTLSSEAMALLEAYDWPGNIRELENVIERAVALEPSSRLTPENLPDHLRDRRLETRDQRLETRGSPPPVPSPFNPPQPPFTKGGEGGISHTVSIAVREEERPPFTKGGEGGISHKGEGWEGVAPVSSLQSQPEGMDLEGALSEMEKALLLDALKRAGGVQTRAARLLGINFRSFRYRLKKYGIRHDDRPLHKE